MPLMMDQLDLNKEKEIAFTFEDLDIECADIGDQNIKFKSCVIIPTNNALLEIEKDKKNHELNSVKSDDDKASVNMNTTNCDSSHYASTHSTCLMSGDHAQN